MIPHFFLFFFLFHKKVHEELRSEGYNPTIIKLMKEFLINSGSFKNEDIKHTVMYVPMGEWGGKLSEMGLKTYYSLLKIFANMIKIPKKQNIDSYLDLINEEINNYKSCMISHRFVARKKKII